MYGINLTFYCRVLVDDFLWDMKVKLMSHVRFRRVCMLQVVLQVRSHNDHIHIQRVENSCILFYMPDRSYGKHTHTNSTD